MDNKYFRIKWFRFVVAIIFNRRLFRWLLTETIEYALRFYYSRRGQGASDVLLFSSYFYDCWINEPIGEDEDSKDNIIIFPKQGD